MNISYSGYCFWSSATFVTTSCWNARFATSYCSSTSSREAGPCMRSSCESARMRCRMPWLFACALRHAAETSLANGTGSTSAASCTPIAAWKRSTAAGSAVFPTCAAWSSTAATACGPPAVRTASTIIVSVISEDPLPIAPPLDRRSDLPPPKAAKRLLPCAPS